jgi:hypothetical protein
MNALEHFLNRATRGLRGQNRLEVREELEAHVLERAHKHEISGLARDAAIDQAVKELGRPETLALSFQDVHMLKQKQLFGAFAIMAVSAIAIWQATLPRAYAYFCQSSDQSLKLWTNANVSWWGRDAFARKLERFPKDKEFPLNAETLSGQIASAHLETKTGQNKPLARIDNSKAITFKILVSYDKGSSDWSKMRCKIE